MTPTDVTFPEIPSFLVRDSNNQSELTRMFVPNSKITYATDEATAGGADSADTKPAKVRAKAKTAPKPVVKAAKGAKKARKQREFDPAKLDQFGFRTGTMKSKAAAMYASKRGATLAEVKAELNSTQFNLLTELEAKGFEIIKRSEDGEGKRKITRYKIVTKK